MNYITVDTFFLIYALLFYYIIMPLLFLGLLLIIEFSKKSIYEKK